jgi:DNA helicase-2/ATP-dependent DNA helicase PcrA
MQTTLLAGSEVAIKEKFLDGLNSAQLEAVSHCTGPLLVLAGAGTGKTKVLTSRIANIIFNKLALPYQILAVTFTNKAAKEMMERVNNVIDASGIWLGTFHSIAAKILRKHGELVGLNSNFTIIDYDDQNRLIKNIMQEEGIDDKKHPPKSILAIIQKWKDIALSPEKLSTNDMSSSIMHIARKIYIEYQQRLRRSNIVDFGDLLLYNIEVFNKYSDILEIYQSKFHYILVDEYQDTNVVQYLWLRLLASKHKNICCVGDDDQSVYSWRGAEVANILRFEQDFVGAKIVKLEENYRSTANILKSASNLIARNQERYQKILWTRGNEGEKVRIISLWDDREEARFIADTICMKSNKYALNDFAILVRAGFQTRAFEECFISRSLPYKIIGGQRFYERKEIKDIIAYIRLTIAHNDNLAFERIINVPKRSIGKATLTQIHDYAKENRVSLFAASKEMVEKHYISKKAGESLMKFVKDIENWRLQFDIRDHSEVVDLIVKESGYYRSYQEEKTLEAESRLENIEELIKAIKEFNNITEFLEHISLVAENDGQSEENVVNIMTLHAAKGLEFKAVFLPGWEEGLFPHQKSLDENGAAGLEEERRLAYVGITRAREELYILHAISRRIFNQWQNSIGSRFLEEVGEESIERVSNNFIKNFNPTVTTERPISPARDVTTKASQEDSRDFILGESIFHKVFGYGVIVSLNAPYVEVRFKHIGNKKLPINYIEKVKN